MKIRTALVFAVVASACQPPPNGGGTGGGGGSAGGVSGAGGGATGGGSAGGGTAGGASAGGGSAGGGSLGGGGADAGTASVNVGFRIYTYDGGLKAAVWYPTREAEVDFTYTNATTDGGVNASPLGRVAPNAAPDDSRRFPLMLFSHGYSGCGIQTTYFTEELARRGFIVAAPDHADALCSVDGSPSRGPDNVNPNVFQPASWTETSYFGRHDDLEHLLEELLADPQFGPRIDTSLMGLSGHSMGGFTAIALAGGYYPSWHDPRFKIVLALSPYVQGELLHGNVGNMHLPVMYQTGQGDLGVKPTVTGMNGAYALSNPPKYYVELMAMQPNESAGHFTWTNLACQGEPTLAQCIQERRLPKQINDYSFAFIDRHLLGLPAPLLQSSGSELNAYRYEAP